MGNVCAVYDFYVDVSYPVGLLIHDLQKIKRRELKNMAAAVNAVAIIYDSFSFANEAMLSFSSVLRYSVGALPKCLLKALEKVNVSP